MKKESKLTTIIKRLVKEEMYNKQFKIKFKNLDGNFETVYVEARNKDAAKKKFEQQYDYDDIIKITEED